MPGGCVSKEGNKFSLKKEGKPDIYFDKYELDKNSKKISREDKCPYAGVVGYAGPGVEPGKVHLKKSADIEIKEGDEGQVHGALVREKFGVQPSEIIKVGGCVDGFAVINGEFQDRSGACNPSGSYSDGKREVNETAREEIKKAIYK